MDDDEMMRDELGDDMPSIPKNPKKVPDPLLDDDGLSEAETEGDDDLAEDVEEEEEGDGEDDY